MYKTILKSQVIASVCCVGVSIHLLVSTGELGNHFDYHGLLPQITFHVICVITVRRKY